MLPGGPPETASLAASHQFVAKRHGALGKFAEHVLYGISHRDRLLNGTLDARQIEGFRWGVAAVQKYACDAMRLDACAND
jgi:hypothetical protein